MRDDWIVGNIEDLCEVEYGTRVVKKRDAGKIYPVYGGGGATFKMDIYNREDRMVIARFGMSEECTRFVKGKFFLNDSGLTISAKDKDSVDDKFLNYQILSLNDLIYSLGRGTAQKNLNVDAFKKIVFGYPKSLTEQQQIVSILDQVFKAIDQAKANIKKNIENAQELFQSKLNEIFSQKGEGWEEKRIKEITTKIGSGATPRGGQASYKESGISLIRSMNVHDDGFRDKKLAFIDEEQAKKLDNVTIQKNDVLLNITGASVARCCVVNNDYLPARVNQHVSIIRLKEGIMNHKFLHYVLTSKVTKDLLLGIGEQGATRQAITKAQIENFRIKFPASIDIQNKYVKSLDNIKNETKQLESAYRNKVDSLDELKKSILQKAFAGELTNKTVEV